MVKKLANVFLILFVERTNSTGGFVIEYSRVDHETTNNVCSRNVFRTARLTIFLNFILMVLKLHVRQNLRRLGSSMVWRMDCLSSKDVACLMYDTLTTSSTLV